MIEECSVFFMLDSPGVQRRQPPPSRLSKKARAHKEKLRELMEREEPTISTIPAQHTRTDSLDSAGTRTRQHLS
jgi:hypothetical protein